jgi:hypothetical protein
MSDDHFKDLAKLNPANAERATGRLLLDPLNGQLMPPEMP